MTHAGSESKKIDLPAEHHVGGGPSSPETTAKGTVRIAPVVLIELIELTVRDITGVTGFQNRHRMERILPRAHEASTGPNGGRVIEAGGVSVHLAGNQIDADVAITVDRDAGMVEISGAIRRQVGIAVNRMLGLDVHSVNVYIAGVRPYAEE